ncbi:hypothetical protein WA026_016555 [Henosepilachna vigintioctopunctata]|uniref:DDE Tnp4 domain-containing protein n=1 Tax=Henosepilachna vigintioctopunctata TaxID=420089 RepID=A0AAW1VFK8_9CUCU
MMTMTGKIGEKKSRSGNTGCCVAFCHNTYSKTEPSIKFYSFPSTPPFLHDGHLTEDEIVNTYNIASVRIHVERCIARIKVYNILIKINIDLLPYIDDIVHMCCVLVNLQPPIFKSEENK